MTWLSEMDSDKKVSLMRSARRLAKDMRKDHTGKEREVLAEITSEMLNDKKADGTKRKRKNVDAPNDGEQKAQKKKSNDK
jgi:hypothetical protein